MNGDHRDDNLLIARAFGFPEASESVMVSVSGAAGTWRVTDAAGEHELNVPWPGEPVVERADIRRAVVQMYKDACAKLGVEARDEHQAAEQKPFSVVVRESSKDDHASSEGASFMEDIMRGKAPKQDYIDLSAQHYFMYVALEAATAKHLENATMASFHRSELERLSALEADLAFLIGDDWADRIVALPATAAYAARINELSAEGWIPGIVAHHYTRYLGDLSGGQYIARRVKQQYELEADGVAFYDFSAMDSIEEFKAEYRSALDALGAVLPEEEQQRMLTEVGAAYAFNTAVFTDLGKAKLATAAA